MDNKTIYIPHGKLAQNPFTNFCKPSRPHWDQVTIGLDHVVPVDRGERLMKAAIIHLPDVHEGHCEVWANTAVASGVFYTVRYLIADHLHYYKARSAVITAIADHLHRYGLRVSESLGEYALSRGGRPYKEVEALDRATMISNVPLFESLSQEMLSSLCEDAKTHFFREGELILHKGDAGDSMFVVAEGVAAVILETNTNEELANQKKKTELGPWGVEIDVVPHKTLRTLHAGHYFGEMALLLGQERSASILAKTDLLLYEITKQMMTPLLKAHPEIAGHMSDIIATRQLELSHAIGKKAEFEKQRALASTKVLEGMKAFFDI